MILDPEAIKQLRETRFTVLDTLRDEPNHFKALVMANALAELDPDHDPALAAHRRRFQATRAAGWALQAKAEGLDGLLFALARGWSDGNIGRAAVPVLEGYAEEIGEARPPGVARGHIDAAYLPAQLTGDARVKLDFHPSGHLARVSLSIDALHSGALVLDRKPGAGSYEIVEERGGSGTMIREHYRDGAVHSILNTPWHDGVESSQPKAWTRWVEENLADLARLSAAPLRQKRRARASKR